MPTTTNEPTYVSMSEAGRRVGVSRYTIRDRVLSGELPAYRLGKGRTVLIKVSDLDALLRPIAAADSTAGWV
ncbi:excisionase family DNA-binding protein [Rhodococcus zopfii]|uniref:excisionase family DNA-binding protein n=1 Tax=Rhodococcus zopfii TaxID=43772 RepID=UPI0011114ACA|nr:excisionase family DNA-binding protein [Rhodococcus zopfii]